MPNSQSIYRSLEPLADLHELLMKQEESQFAAWLAITRASSYPQLARSAEAFLSAQEWEFFRQRKFRARQQSYLLGRYAAKRALSQSLGETIWKQIDVSPGVFNQPIVRHSSLDISGVSISHCADLALAVAFPAGHPLSLDVEPLDPSRTATIKTQLTPKERSRLKENHLPPATLCALLWTAREALSKILLCGLSTSPEILAVAESRQHKHLHWESRYVHFAQYKCLSWITPQHVISLALPHQTTLCEEAKCAQAIQSSATPPYNAISH